MKGPQWAGFLEAWHIRFGTSQYTTGQLIEKLKEEAAFAALLPDELAALPLEDAKDLKSFSVRLGRLLRKYHGTPFGVENYRLHSERDKHSKQNLWSVCCVPAPENKPSRLLWAVTSVSVSACAEPPVEPSVQDEEPGWCGPRERIIELGARCQPPFPLLIYMRGQMLDAGKEHWEKLVHTASIEIIPDLLLAAERRASRPYGPGDLY